MSAPGSLAHVLRETAFAKLNLVLHVGPPGEGGMHSLCSLFASIELADEVELRAVDGPDAVVCPGVEEPNLASLAVAALREHVALPPVEIRIEKRIPVAAGLGGASADAAAVLRAANRLLGEPLDRRALTGLAAELGSDVPSQIEPRHTLVAGTGELLEPIALPALAAVLVPQSRGLLTGDVYAELDRRRGWRARLGADPLRRLAAEPPQRLAGALENDLQPAATALRPALEHSLAALREGGALGAAVSGSGPTCFGLFADDDRAQRAAARIEGAIFTRLRSA